LGALECSAPPIRDLLDFPALDVMFHILAGRIIGVHYIRILVIVTAQQQRGIILEIYGKEANLNV